MVVNRAIDRCILMAVLASLGCNRPAGSSDVTPTPIVAAEQPKEDPPPVKKEAREEPLPEGKTFEFPQDEGGKALSKMLTPSAPGSLGPPSSKTTPIVRALPSKIAQPEVPAATTQARLPRIPLPPRVAPRPTPLPDRVPTDLAGSMPGLPERIRFHEGPMTKLETPDVKRPTDLPVLATPNSPRASLEDPTTEFTLQSILNNSLPLRSTMAPFVKVNLPDPFENVGPARVKISVPDDPMKSIGNPPPPKP